MLLLYGEPLHGEPVHVQQLPQVDVPLQARGFSPQDLWLPQEPLQHQLATRVVFLSTW